MCVLVKANLYFIMAKNLKELNARVEELAVKFDKGMSDFKKTFMDSNVFAATVPSGGELPKSDLESKFISFKRDILASLASLKDDISHLKQTQLENSVIINKVQMLHNSNNLIIHGITETPEVDIYNAVIDLFHNKLKVEVKKTDISNCYRLGPKNSNKKCRPIVVQFIHRWIRDLIYFSKKQLKGSKILITEMLSTNVIKLLKNIRGVMGNSVWTQGGIIYILHNNQKRRILSENAWLELQDEINATGQD